MLVFRADTHKHRKRDESAMGVSDETDSPLRAPQSVSVSALREDSH